MLIQQSIFSLFKTNNNRRKICEDEVKKMEGATEVGHKKEEETKGREGKQLLRGDIIRTTRPR